MKRTMALDALGVVSVLIPLVVFGACGSSGNGGAGGSAGGTGKVDGGRGGSSGSTLDANVPDGSIQFEVGTAGGNRGAGGSTGGIGKVDGGRGGSSGSTLDANVPSGGAGGSTRDAGGADVAATFDTATALDSNALDGAGATVPQQCLAGLVNPFAAMAPDWANWSSSSCSSVTAADGGLVLTQNEPCSAASPNAIAGLAPPNVLCGDFDVQVDFAVTGLVAGVTGGIFASMRANDPTVTTNGMTIERYAAGYLPLSSQSYQNYKSYTTNQGEDTTSVLVPTTDVTGRFRLTRAGTTVKSYYWKTGAPDGQWVLVNTATLTNTPWVLVLYEGDNSAANRGPAPYSVTFSNLLVTFPSATDAGTIGQDAPITLDTAQIDAGAIDTGGTTSCPVSLGGAVCTGDLSNIGTGDFRISFTVTTTQTTELALVNQRSVCDYGMFWDIRMQPNGFVSAETCDVANAASYVGLLAGAHPINDGKPHDVLVQRAGGVLSIYVDCDNLGSVNSTSSFTALAPLASGADACIGVDGTVALVGTIANVCVGHL